MPQETCKYSVDDLEQAVKIIMARNKVLNKTFPEVSFFISRITSKPYWFVMRSPYEELKTILVDLEYLDFVYLTNKYRDSKKGSICLI